MSFIRILVGALFVFLVSGLPADQAANASPISTKPGLELLFNGVIHLADFSPPIPIPAGQRIGKQRSSSSNIRKALECLAY